MAALALPATASAHSRASTVALDYRLTLSGVPRGIDAKILDGDRALRLAVPRDRTVVVLGDLGEPMLRFADGVWVNEHSPTAEANRLVGVASVGWRQLSRDTTFAWHEHRLSPPPYASGVSADWSIPLIVDGKRTAIGGAFVRVARPRALFWLGGAAIVAALAFGVLRVRPSATAVLTIGSGLGAGLAALVAQTAFALRDSPGGHAGWATIGISIVVGVVAAWLVAVGRGARRAYVCGAIGAGVAALTLSWLGVFLHGAVISALPALAVRLLCVSALTGGVVALIGSLNVRVDDT